MSRSKVRCPNHSDKARASAMAIGSMDIDRHRDINDLNAMRRVVLVYMPLMALTPLITATLYLFGR